MVFGVEGRTGPTEISFAPGTVHTPATFDLFNSNFTVRTPFSIIWTLRYPVLYVERKSTRNFPVEMPAAAHAKPSATPKTRFHSFCFVGQPHANATCISTRSDGGRTVRDELRQQTSEQFLGIERSEDATEKVKLARAELRVASTECAVYWHLMILGCNVYQLYEALLAVRMTAHAQQTAIITRAIQLAKTDAAFDQRRDHVHLIFEISPET